MAKLEEVISTEQQREDAAKWQQIHLFKEGNFYRAYEQSAWLMSRFGGSELQAKKHKTKQTPDGSFVFVGFPVSSLDKFRPQDSEESSAGENHQVLSLPDSVFPAEVSPEILSADYQKWKGEIAYTDTKQESDDRKKNNNASDEKRSKSDSQMRITDVMHDVLAYPLESKSPMETMLFVAELKQRLSSIL